MFKLYKVSKKSHNFIEDNFQRIAKSEDTRVVIDCFFVPYSPQKAEEASVKYIAFFFAKKHLEKQTYCYAHLFGTNVALKNPKQYLKLLIKWHPTTDIYSCERVSQLHDTLQSELGHKSKINGSRTKI